MPTFNFTYPVPDEIWVENWSQGLTGTLAYKGPAEVNMWFDDYTLTFVGSDFDLDSDQDGMPDTTQAGHEGLTKITVNAGDGHRSAAACWLAKLRATDQNTNAMDSDELPDEVTTDITTAGRNYQKITNPRPDHLFDLALTDEGGEDSPGFALEHILKHPESHHEFEAKKRKAKVQYYVNTYDLGTDAETAGTNYISAVDDYLESIDSHYPWQFITVPMNTVPKIPLSVMTAVSTITSAVGPENDQYDIQVLDYTPTTMFWE